jgi:hypothetical protein
MHNNKPPSSGVRLLQTMGSGVQSRACVPTRVYLRQLMPKAEEAEGGVIRGTICASWDTQSCDWMRIEFYLFVLVSLRNCVYFLVISTLDG